MNRIRITTAQNVDIDFEAAGIGDRAVAAIIDYSILLSYIIGANLILPSETPVAVRVGLAIPYLLYFLISELAFNGQSIGKKIRRIKVARMDGRQPGWGDYLLRWLFRLIEIDLSAGMIALATMFFRHDGQRLGDVAAGTVMIKLRPQVGLADTLYRPAAERHAPSFENIDSLADEDIHLIRDVLEAVQKNPSQVEALGGRLKLKLEQKMGESSDADPVLFLQRVLADYNHMHRVY